MQARCEMLRPDRQRTIAPHGLTAAELRRLDGARHQMEKCIHRYGGQIWWLTTHKESSRETIGQVQKLITRGQNGLRLPQYSLWVFECGGGLHAHIVFVANAELILTLKRSASCAEAHIERVPDFQGLTKGYLSKERTSSAGYYRRDLGGRISGSHRLEGGGDRVRLSKALKEDSIEAGFVQPWQPTYAKRKSPAIEKKKAKKV